MWAEVIQGGLVVLSLAYHRWRENEKPIPTTSEVLRVPVVDGGGAVPLIFGRCRVDRPQVVWSGNVTGAQDPLRGDGFFVYEGDILYVVGIPFGVGTVLLQGIFVRGERLDNGGIPSDFPANIGGVVSYTVAGPLPSTSPDFTFVGYEFGDGADTQDIGTASNARDRMIVAGVNPNTIPSFRGQVTMFVRVSVNAPELPALAFEVSSYPGQYLLPYFIGAQVGQEANPAVVIAALLTDRFGKLGRDVSTVLDVASFKTAAETLAAEGHGYSRAFDERQDASEMIGDVLRQIDGVLYEEPRTGLFVLKLIRADYDPNALLQVDPSNCEGLENFDAGWGANTVNKIVVNYPSRALEYANDQATASDLANGVGQDGEVNELVLSFPGCCTSALAEAIAARELAARSRPLMKCRAKVDRRFWNTRPGDPVLVSWPKYHVASKVFRVVGVNRGNASDNHVLLDLVEEFFYVHRSTVFVGGEAPPHPTAPVLG